MAKRTFADSPTNPTTTLAADLTASATTLTLASDPAAEMPTTGPFSVVVGTGGAEQPVNCASRSGTAVTLVAPWAGNTHAAGSPVNTGLAKIDADAFAQADDLAGKANTAHTHAQSDVTNLPTDLAAKVAKTGDTMTGTLNGTAFTASTSVNLPNTSGTTTNVRLGGNAQDGLFGSRTSSPRRFGLKLANIVLLDMTITGIGSGASRFQSVPLRAEAGFSSGLQEVLDEDFCYVAAGGKVIIDNTGGAVSFTMGDALDDPVFIDQTSGAEVTITDYYGNATTAPITIDLIYPLPTGETTAVINADGGHVRLVAMDSMWVLAGSQGAVFT